MTEKPLLRLPEPKSKKYVSQKRMISENLEFPTKKKQREYFEPKFQRLSQVLNDPRLVENWTPDPSSIAPERALVFEIASSALDFEQAIRRVNGLEFLGEEFYNTSPVREFRNIGDSSKDISLIVYFTMPDAKALRELLRLWEIYKTEREFKSGFKQWKKVFESLVDLRPWGPNDRLTKDTIENWKFEIEEAPEIPVKLEVEFWYRKNSVKREKSHTQFKEIVLEVGGQILDQTTIPEIQYDAALVELPTVFIHQIIKDRSIKLVEFSDIMFLLPQSAFRDVLTLDEDIRHTDEIFEINSPTESEGVTTKYDDVISYEENSKTQISSHSVQSDSQEPFLSDNYSAAVNLENPIVALLDGLPLANHSKLANRLEIDDPDSYTRKYGKIGYFKHGTSMASAIIHGDLNSRPSNSPISCKLYVRPVLYPIQFGYENEQTYVEQIPSDRLILDLTWRCFVRMFQGDNHSDPVAPNIKVVNLSIGNDNRRFHNIISPWARLVDYLAWKFKVLVIVSAGNIKDEFPLDEVKSIFALERAEANDREEIVIKGLLKKRANRTLLSPSESVNAITVGARHFDEVVPVGSRVSTVDPFESTFLPNPSSALGLGYMRSIKPDILMPAGRELIESNSSESPFSVSASGYMSRLFGIRTAAPGQSGDITKEMNYSGTSVATALATHFSVKIIQNLNNFPDEPVYPDIPEDFMSVLIKTMLVHATKWDKDLATRIECISKNLGTTYWEHNREDVSRLLGFGTVDIARLFDCSDKRATLIGCGFASSKEAKEYTLPLPMQLKDVIGYRAITVTVGWLTPVNSNHRKYWMTRFRVVPNGKNKRPIGLDLSKTQPSPNSAGKGTVFHKRWEGEKASAFIDEGEVKFDLICEPTAGNLDVEIPYGIAISIEVDEEMDIHVYSEVKNRLYQMVRPPIRP